VRIAFGFRISVDIRLGPHPEAGRGLIRRLRTVRRRSPDALAGVGQRLDRVSRLGRPALPARTFLGPGEWDAALVQAAVAKLHGYGPTEVAAGGA
jgi:hypothetical protein